MTSRLHFDVFYLSIRFNRLLRIQTSIPFALKEIILSAIIDVNKFIWQLFNVNAMFIERKKLVVEVSYSNYER